MPLASARVSSKVRLRGDLQVEVRRAADGGLVRRMAVRNTITYDGQNSPLFLWAPDGIVTSDYAIATLQAGTNGTPPSPGDVGLYAPVAGGPTGGVITLAAANRTRSTATGEVVITGSLDGTHANGNTLLEAGLFLANGQLFARQVHPAIAKTSLITVSYSWRVAVTR